MHVRIGLNQRIDPPIDVAKTDRSSGQDSPGNCDSKIQVVTRSPKANTARAMALIDRYSVVTFLRLFCAGRRYLTSITIVQRTA